MAPTLALVVPNTILQLLGPAAVMGAVGVQLKVHPPNAAPAWAGVVRITVEPIG